MIRVRRKVGIWGILAALVLGFVAAAAIRAPWSNKTAPVHPVIMVGLDGLEWDVVLPLLRAGRLPNLQSLIDRGVAGEIQTLTPTLSPTIWTTIATGVGREEHGILGFVKKRGSRRTNPILFTSQDRLTKAVWNILSDAGRLVTVIGWWNTYPAEPVNGVIVAQVNTLNPGGSSWKDMRKGGLVADLENQVSPPQLQDELLAHISGAAEDMPRITRTLLGDFRQPMDTLEERLWTNCEWSLRSDAAYHRIALDLLSRDHPFDLFAIYYGGTDVASHRFWRYYEPEKYDFPASDNNIRDFGRAIPAYYTYIDARVGELLAAAPEDCNVLIVSDHGMTASDTDLQYTAQRSVRNLVSGNHENAPAGFFVAAGPDVRRADPPVPGSELTRSQVRETGSVHDVTPTLLALLGVPVGRDMEGSVMEDVVNPDFLKNHPVQWVDSHTPPNWWEDRQAELQGPHLSEERLDQLRSLGYIE